jgi:16S rRNA (cytosine967-C5)-methyltransferase
VGGPDLDPGPLSPADRRVVEALAAAAAPGAAADRVLKATLRAHPELSGAERARVGVGVHGVRCFAGRLAHLLTAVGLPHTPAALWAAYRVDLLGEPPADVAAALDLPGATLGLRRIAARAVRWPEDPDQALAARRSLPLWVAQRWRAAFGDAEADALADALNHPAPTFLRARGPRELVARRLVAEGAALVPGHLAPHALRLTARFDLRGSAAWREGLFEVQDEGSQLVAEAVQARPGQTVLDLCAGSGGKTLALAAQLEDRGRLVAADVEPARLADLRGRVGQRKLTCVEALQLPAELPWADRILVDAPCSSLGTWRRGPDRRWRTSPAEVDALARVQVSLLDAAARRLRPGGRLVYATCTLLEAENEAVVRALQAAHPGLRPAPCLAHLPAFDAAPFVTLLPHRHGTDGFFIAAFEAPL